MSNLSCSYLTCERIFAILAGVSLGAFHILWKKKMFVFEKKYISKYNKFFFSGQMSLGLIVELLKKAPVILKRLESFWQIALIQSRFSGYLSVAVGRRHCSVTGQ